MEGRMSTLSLRSSGANEFRGRTESRLTVFVSAVVAELRARRATRQVEAMSDEMLRDIGLSRASIDQAVRVGRISA